MISLDFQGNMSEAEFENQFEFSTALIYAMKRALKRTVYYANLKEYIEEIDKEIERFGERFNLVKLFTMLSDMCADAPKLIVLIVDEVDQAFNNQVFLDFLTQLSYYYLNKNKFATFQSVILAGIHDIRNLKQKIRPDSEHKHNSPWNIASDFDANMNFSTDDISGILREYEFDFHTGIYISYNT